jgi:tetratricopeptide (TPR) repeat protein
MEDMSNARPGGGKRSCPTEPTMTATANFQRLKIGLLLAAAVTMVAGAFAWPQIRLSRTLAAARQALADRDYPRALDALQRAESLDATNGETAFLLSRTYRHLGKLAELQQWLARARVLGYQPRRIELEELLLLAQNGRMKVAAAQLPRLLTEFSETDGAEICEAYVSGFFSNYNFAEGLRLAEVWQQDYPRDPQPFFSLGLYEAHAGSDKKAVEAFRRALELAPQRDDIRRYLAEALVDEEQYDEAERHVRDLLRRNPNDTDMATALGHCLLEKGNVAGARQQLLEVLKKDPQGYAPRMMMAQIELKDQQPAAAIEWLEKLVQERPKEYRLRFLYATALQQSGRGDEAADHLEFVGRAQAALGRARNLMDQAKEDPNDIASRLEIGQTLLRYDSPDDGAAWLRNVLELDPRNAAAHRSLAEYFLSKDDSKRAAYHEQQAAATELGSDPPAPPSGDAGGSESATLPSSGR